MSYNLNVSISTKIFKTTQPKMMEHQNQQDLVPTGAPAEVPNDPG